MKKEILMLIIGILIGAIITTGVFLVLKGNNGKEMQRMDRGEPPTSMDGNIINDGGKMRGRPNEENTATEQENTTNTNV